MELTQDNIKKTFMACLYSEAPKDMSEVVVVDGLTGKFGFNPIGLEEQKDNILAMLLHLPEQFMMSKGGGWSFLNGCVDNKGNQYGDQPIVDNLFVLGMAVGKVTCMLPRDLWPSLPGGVPYYQVNDFDENGEIIAETL